MPFQVTHAHWEGGGMVILGAVLLVGLGQRYLHVVLRAKYWEETVQLAVTGAREAEIAAACGTTLTAPSPHPPASPPGRRYSNCFPRGGL
jgi:hypothetical protein